MFGKVELSTDCGSTTVSKSNKKHDKLHPIHTVAWCDIFEKLCSSMLMLVNATLGYPTYLKTKYCNARCGCITILAAVRYTRDMVKLACALYVLIWDITFHLLFITTIMVINYLIFLSSFQNVIITVWRRYCCYCYRYYTKALPTLRFHLVWLLQIKLGIADIVTAFIKYFWCNVLEIHFPCKVLEVRPCKAKLHTSTKAWRSVCTFRACQIREPRSHTDASATLVECRVAPWNCLLRSSAARDRPAWSPALVLGKTWSECRVLKCLQ